MSPDSSPQVRGRVVGPPLDESDVDQLDELAREGREDALVEGREDEEQEAGDDEPSRLIGDDEEAAPFGADGGVEVPAHDEQLEESPVLDSAPIDVALEEEAVLTVELEADGVESGEGYEDTFDGLVEGTPDSAAVEAPTPYTLLRFVDVVMVLPATSPVLVLEEAALPSRQLRIPIGSPEGVAIAYAARRLSTPKPLTHELMITLLESYSLTIDAVRITDVTGSAYSAELVCSGPAGSCTVACRPSDGVALALRQRLPAPILAAPEVLERAGVEVELGG